MRPATVALILVLSVWGSGCTDDGDRDPSSMIPVFIQTQGDDAATIRVWVETAGGTRLYETAGTVEAGQTKRVGAFSAGPGNHTVRALWEGAPASDDLVIRPESPASEQVEKVLAAITSDAFRVDVWYTYDE